ncbi:MAG: 23S rRNA (adenine(2503)-C(2))-methyltransferase RlmN [Clostridia bacterium]|nr:23S rRNA (adenine(2503)-C(2))-methyltransferase RlmN [Clostridia bacterium]
MLLPVPGDPQKTDIVSLTADELSSALSDLKLPKFRISQIQKGILAGRGIDGLTNLPLSLRAELNQRFAVPSVTVASKQVSSDGTEKYLFALGDGSFVEGVFMRYNHGNTLCISTQVGCRMGCAFCASGLDGLLRGLNPSEMLGEIAAAEKETGERVGGVVMMGTGEPLDNYDASVQFIRTVSSPDSFNIGQRHISLSTSGIVPKIFALEKEDLSITLSVSLHAPFDDIRTQLMPVNKSWHVSELIAAATHYQNTTGRRVSYEYAMISGLNDTPRCAHELVRLLGGKEAHLNLIRLNEIAESPFHPSTPAALSEFMAILEKGRVNTTLRRRLGKDIDGACGQLRRRVAPQN